MRPAKKRFLLQCFILSLPAIVLVAAGVIFAGIAWPFLIASGIAGRPLTVLLCVLGPSILILILASSALSIYSIFSYAKSRDDFVAATVHDFGTPLAALKMAIGHDDAMAKTLVRRLIWLVDNMRDTRSGVEGKMLYCEEVRLRELFDAAYSLFASDYRARRGKDIAVSGDLSLEVSADPAATERIIWNILGNELKYAVQYSDVDARIYSSGECVSIEISDRGPGMSACEMKHAFDRYWRSKKSKRSGIGGTGIGLAVARELAAAMGATLSLKPNNPTGCIFTLAFKKSRSV